MTYVYIMNQNRSTDRLVLSPNKVTDDKSAGKKTFTKALEIYSCNIHWKKTDILSFMPQKIIVSDFWVISVTCSVYKKRAVGS